MRQRDGETLAIVVILLAAAAMPATANAAGAPAFVYDRAKTPTYLGQTLRGTSTGSASQLREELAATVREILDGPWLPLYSDYSAGQAGGVGAAEWCFDRPGDYARSLSLAAPYLAGPTKTKAREFLRDLLKTSPPTRQVYLSPQQGKPRNIRQTPAPSRPWIGEAQTQPLLFGEGYAVWAYAAAFDAWDEARPLFEDLKNLRAKLAVREDFTPVYKEGHAGPLTAAAAEDAAYRFQVYQALRSGFQDNYWYRGARLARERMQKDKPVFFYVRTLAALVGYHRLAEHYRQRDEAQWARETFDRVATQAVGHQSAPYLWSDPALCPEIGRLLRDAAGGWLDELARTPNVGNLPATDWDNKVVPGKRDNYVMNPFTWYHAWGGQGEGIRPRSVLGAFLANAYLLGAPAKQVAETRDIPWCKADLYYAIKLVAAIQAAEQTPWTAAF